MLHAGSSPATCAAGGGAAAHLDVPPAAALLSPSAQRWVSSAPPRRPIDARRAPHRVVQIEATIFLHLKAGTWNVKNGIPSPGRRDFGLKTAKDLGIDILAIPEAALAGLGRCHLGARRRPATRTSTTTAILLSPHAILLSPHAASAPTRPPLASWEARVAKATWDNRGDNTATATGDVGADG